LKLVYKFDMGSFGPNFGINFAAISTSTPVIIFPTKKLTAKLCARTNVTEKLCSTTAKENLGV